MRTPIVLALIIILAPYGSSTEGTKIYDHSGESILNDLSPVVQSAFKRAMSNDAYFEGHHGAWILLSDSGLEVLAQTLPAGQLTELDLIKERICGARLKEKLNFWHLNYQRNWG